MLSYKVFMSFVGENSEATRLLSDECFRKWVETRKSPLKQPEESFRRVLTAHVCGLDGRRPFPEKVEASLLDILRQRKVWQCFEGTESSIGIRGFRNSGYHESRKGNFNGTVGNLKATGLSVNNDEGSSELSENEDDINVKKRQSKRKRESSSSCVSDDTLKVMSKESKVEACESEKLAGSPVSWLSGADSVNLRTETVGNISTRVSKEEQLNLGAAAVAQGNLNVPTVNGSAADMTMSSSLLQLELMRLRQMQMLQLQNFHNFQQFQNLQNMQAIQNLQNLQSLGITNNNHIPSWPQTLPLPAPVQMQFPPNCQYMENSMNSNLSFAGLPGAGSIVQPNNFGFSTTSTATRNQSVNKDSKDTC